MCLLTCPGSPHACDSPLPLSLPLSIPLSLPLRPFSHYCHPPPVTPDSPHHPCGPRLESALVSRVSSVFKCAHLCLSISLTSIACVAWGGRNVCEWVWVWLCVFVCACVCMCVCACLCVVSVSGTQKTDATWVEGLVRHSTYGQTTMGKEWGTNCTIAVPTIDACVNASLIEDSGRIEGNLDPGSSSSLPAALPLHFCQHCRVAKATRQRRLTRAARVTGFCAQPPVKGSVSPYMFLASTGSVVMQRCLYTDFFGCVCKLCCIHSCVLGCMCVAVRCSVLQYVAVCCIHCRFLGCIQVALRHGLMTYLDATVCAAHCNTLQHSTLQHSATKQAPLRHGLMTYLDATVCAALQHSATQHTATLCDTLLAIHGISCIALCVHCNCNVCTLQHSATLCSPHGTHAREPRESLLLSRASLVKSCAW